MKIINAFFMSLKKRDNRPSERLEYSKIMSTIEANCKKYLRESGDVFEFEALPNAIDATLAVLDSEQFTNKYEFNQISETCFLVRLKELDLI